MRFAIFSRRMVTEDGMISAVAFTEGEQIVGVEPCIATNHREVIANLSPDSKFVDASDFVVSPGIIDTHVHVNEPGRTQWEGFTTATRAAAAGGVTTLLDMPLNSSPVTTNLPALRAKQASPLSEFSMDVGFYAGLIPGNEAELESLIENGVFGAKAFLCDSGLDEFPASDEATLRAALPVLKRHGLPLLVHAEMVSELDQHLSADDVRSYRRYVDSRPPEFELAAIELLVRLCREFETDIHIVHLATAKALPLIRSAKLDGLPITVETCPHYLFFDDTDINDGQTEFKCAPPIRDIANRMLLCEAVADGTIDTIGSDHSPCPPALKMPGQGDFKNAWGGISGLQLLLSATWSVGEKLDWSPQLIAEKLSAEPARVFGLSGNGKIAAGYRADFVIWNPEESFEVKGEQLYHRHSVTPYHGRKLSGVVRSTYLRGQKIYDADADTPFGICRRGRVVSRRETPVRMITNSIAGYLNALDDAELVTALNICCASQRWGQWMMDGGCFTHDANVMLRAEFCWRQLDESDYLQAFDAHPCIGDIGSLQRKFANTKEIAGGEQGSVKMAGSEILNRLAAANQQYFKKFGFIFIVFATGKSAGQMLQLLESRLTNDRQTEICNAAAEQLKITKLRLQKMPES